MFMDSKNIENSAYNIIGKIIILIVHSFIYLLFFVLHIKE